jgi:hypothetical protein
MTKNPHLFNRKLLFALLCALASFALSAKAQTVTFSGTHLKTGGQYQVAGDFNDDGRQDLAVAGTDVEILLGLGNGNFQTGSRYRLLNVSSASPTSIIKGDFNGDGRVDLAAALNAPNQIAVLVGNGDGTFQPLVRYATGSGGTPSSLAAADFNRDGRTDLMTTDEIDCSGSCVVTNTVSLLLGNGDGTFAAPQHIVVGNAPTKAAVGDFNGDGISDVAVTAGTGGKVFTLLGNGDGTFRRLPDIIVVPTSDNTDVAVGDFNSDTIQDLVVAAEGESKLGTLLGNGDGTFGAAAIINDDRQQRAAAFTLADLNRDGRTDIVLGNGDCCAGGADMGAFSVLYGNGNGTFQPFSRYITPVNGRVGLAALNPIAADFNGDGKTDIASFYFSNMGGTTIGTLIAMNTTGVAPARLALGSMSVSPVSVIGSTQAEINIPLAPNAVAPSGLTTFTVTSSNPSVASVPTNSTTLPLGIAGGMTNLRFIVTTNNVITTQNVTITASNKNLGSRSVTLTVTPPNTPLAVGSLALQPPVVLGGNDVNAVVSLATGHLAPAGGAFVTLSSDNPNLVSMPNSVTIPAGQSNVSVPIQTNTTGITTPVNISASYGGATKTATLSVNAPEGNIPISSVTLSPETVVGGSNIGVRLTVNLASGAPLEGATIMLSSSNPAIVSLPRSIRTNFTGQTSTFADFAPASVAAPTQVTITATYGNSTQSAILTVTPPATNAPSIIGLTINPASVAGGSAAQGTVTLSAAASTATTVTLTSSSSPIVSVPASVTVPAGSTSANFTVSTTNVSSSFAATIGASLNGISRSATITVTPSGDTVGISRAEYTASNRALRVEASSNRTNATLQVFVTSTGQLIGTLSNNGGGKYSGQLSWSVNPQNITVLSNFGGSASRAVTLK